MKKNTRNLCAGALGTAVMVSLYAFAAHDAIRPARSSNPAPASLATLAHRLASGSVQAQHTIFQRTVPLVTAAAQTSFDRFIVKYQEGTAAQQSTSTLLSALDAAAKRAGVAGLRVAADGVSTTLSIEYVRRLSTGASLIRMSRGLSLAEARAWLSRLRADPAVAYAQPDFIKQHTDFAPNDPGFNLQWHYTDPAAGIGAPTAWDISSGQGAVVAVLDTGYLDHSDLNANIVAGYDFIIDTDVSGDGDGRDADAHDTGDWVGSGSSSFHGTHVAGTVAATTNNGIGLAGVAYGAKVQPVRVLGHGGGYTSDIADAIAWASGGSVAGVPANSNPAEVINMSLGGYGSCSDDPVTQAAIDGAIARGVTVVVAAGNDNGDAAQHSPASCRGVITVGATGIDGARSYFSNYGPTVTLSAPGGNATSGSDPDDRWIWSLGNTGTQAPVASPAGDAIIGMIGTSMASPHVAGVVALMQSAAVAAGKPVLTPAQVKTILRNTVKPFSVMPPISKPQGPGILDAAAAVYAATQDVPADLGLPLDNRVALGGQTGATGDSVLYQITVPAGMRSLNLRSYGGSGDVSLYASFAAIPTPALYGRKSAKAGNSEAIVYTNPAPGVYYVRMVGEQPFANVTVLGVYQ